MKKSSQALAIALAALFLLGCSQSEDAPQPKGMPLPDDAPRLVLFLVVDQGRADYLDRFADLWSGGVARLLAEAVDFTDAHHDHSGTTTAPGHATLATGAHPSRHGIIGNGWFDRLTGEDVYAVENDAGETTPERLLAPTFGAWLKAAAPAAKVFAAGGKDRASVLLAGREADGAFWYSRRTGEFTTSPFYAEDPEVAYPWLEAFHEEHHVDRIYGTLWEPLPEVEENAARYDLKSLDGGIFDLSFPHALGGPGPKPGRMFYNSIYRSPMVDEYLARFAAELIDREEIGADATTDYLGLSFSAVDTVGHNYGPGSPEILDALLRLDRALGKLLAFVDEKIGLDNVLVVLTSDHGVAPVPEVRSARGEPARRLGDEAIPCVQRTGKSLDARFGEADWLADDLYLDPGVALERAVDLDALASTLAEELEKCPGIERAWTRAEIAAGPADPIGRLFANSFHPERSPDLLIQLEPYTLASSARTTHGTPQEYDTHVPWLLRLPSGRTATVDERVHTVDVAPTVASLIGLEITSEVDGTDRSGLFP